MDMKNKQLFDVNLVAFSKRTHIKSTGDRSKRQRPLVLFKFKSTLHNINYHKEKTFKSF